MAPAGRLPIPQHPLWTRDLSSFILFASRIIGVDEKTLVKYLEIMVRAGRREIAFNKARVKIIYNDSAFYLYVADRPVLILEYYWGRAA